MKKKILFVTPNMSSFVKKDIAILSKEYIVNEYVFSSKHKAITPLLFIQQFLFLLSKIWKIDLIIIQFAAYHSFLPTLFTRLFNKPSLIIAGGMDTVSFPSIGYGNFNKKLLGIFTRWSYQLAKHISPKHESLVIHNYTYQGNDYPQQGIRYFCPNLKTPFTIIYNGYDEQKWYKKTEKKKNTFITVSGGLQYPFQIQLKGIDLIIEAASAFPNCEFIIIGVPPDLKFPVKSSNITLVPPVSNEQLIDYYSKAEFYMQLSMAEGFPNALCEAMLCECIPIGSEVFSIPEIIADTGFILQKRNPDLLKYVIEQAINCNKSELSKKARARIANNYSSQRRETKLLKLIAALF